MQEMATELMGVAELPAREPALQTAAQLDEFCAGVDIQIGVNVISQGQVFPGTKLRALAEVDGHGHRRSGRFVRCDDNGNVLYMLFNQETDGFSAESMKTLSTHGVTFLLDVPRVANGDRVLTQMVELARRFAEALNGALVDDNRRPIVGGVPSSRFAGRWRSSRRRWRRIASCRLAGPGAAPVLLNRKCRMSAGERVRVLREEIEQHNHQYYVLDAPLISDAEYDRLFRRVAGPRSRTSRTAERRFADAEGRRGAAARVRAVAHATPMLSLNNAFADDEVAAFDRRVAKGWPPMAARSGVFGRTQVRRSGGQPVVRGRACCAARRAATA
jgi:hypothetical protein